MRKHLKSIDLEKVQTKISEVESIWVDDFFTNGANLVRQVTLIWTNEMKTCRTREAQQERIDQASSKGRHPLPAFPKVIEYKQYKIDDNGSVIVRKPSYGSCYVGAFMRWVNKPPKARTEKCQHCNGTGRVPCKE